MNWTTEDIYNCIKVYNRIYFDNEIKQPIIVKWSRHLSNADSNTDAYMQTYTDGHHVLMINATLSTATKDVLKNTIVHEMIHAWQGEWDEDGWGKINKGHGPKFQEWCEYLNTNFNFKFPIQQFAGKDEVISNNRNTTGAYFIYNDIEYTSGIQHVGVFCKFLYKEEIDAFIRHGLHIVYINKPVFNQSCHFVELENKPLPTAFIAKYTRIAKLNDKSDIDDQLKELGLRSYIFKGSEFNFNSGTPVTESYRLTNAIRLLESYGYQIG